MTNNNPLFLLPTSSTLSLHSLLLYLLLLLSSSATPTLHCLDSSDCHPGQFCHFSLGSTFCLDCRNCHADFQRHRARTESGCARNGWECGACLRGYAEQKLHASEGRVAELCVSDTGGLESTGNQPPPCVVNDGIGPCDVVCVVGIFLVAVAVLLVALQLKIVNDRYRAGRRARSSARTMSDMEEDTSGDVEEDGCIQSAEGGYRQAGENYRVGVENYRAGGEAYRPRGENYGSGPDVDNYRYFLRFFFNNSRVPPVPPFPPPPYNENRTTAQSNSQRRQRKPF